MSSKKEPKIQKTIKKKTTDDTGKKIKSIVDEIKEKYGEGAVMKLGEAKKVDVNSISTGSISLDIALGIGGIPKGRVIEIYGPESSGKTTLSLHIVAESQKKDGVVAFIDAEHALDPEYARKIGVKVDDLLISQPDTGEQALNIVETMVRSGAVDLIIIDSVAALTPRAEIEGRMEDQQIGLQARLMSHALRKLTAIVAKSGTSVIFINQIRMRIGIMFGNPETTPGGKALKFYSSVRIEVRKAAQLKKGDEVIGVRVKAKVVKNKVAPPFKVAEFDILYDEGISHLGDVIYTGVKYNAIKKAGSWLSFNGKKLGQGVEASREYLRKNPKTAQTIEKKIYQAIKNEKEF
jgi:recombination protein RecA